MLIFEELKYKNFLSTGDKFTTVNLNESSATLVVGSNGAGKSTMLDALSFALFGKPHRNIKIPQLVNSINNKKLIVEVKFKLGLNKYKVIRGRKPNIFEIYHNGELVNQESHSRDYQKILETNILKLNHKSFHQVVVLGSSNFIPFMQLPSNQRRLVIEDLLDIGIFTKMNTILKERYSIIRSDLNDTSHQLDILDQQIYLQEKHISDLKTIDLQQATKAAKKIEDLKSEMDLLRNRSKELQTQYDESHPKISDDLEKVISKRNKLNNFKSQMKTNLDSVIKDAEFYENNDYCPTCSQTITLELKEKKSKLANNKKKQFKDALEEMDNAISDSEVVLHGAKDRMKKISDLLYDITSNQSLIKNLDKQSKELEDQSKISNAATDTKNAETELNTRREEKAKMVDHKSDQVETRSYYDAINEMLKDTGIKTKIIREYLPIMNKLINQYLNILDFFVLFNLDESFNETIKSRHRDEFSYASFSEGEKSRIDLALLFSWRQIARIKNSANTNLLILDETFDSSLDVDGVDNLLKILYSLKENTNVFIISHKKDLLDGKFPARIEFEKTNNFSRIKPEIG